LLCLFLQKRINESLRQQKQKEKEGYLTRSRVHLPPKRENRQSICSKEGQQAIAWWWICQKTGMVDD